MIACACSSADCLRFGCAQMRRSGTWPGVHSPAALPADHPKGWECPKCGSVHAPHVPSCFTCRPKKLEA